MATRAQPLGEIRSMTGYGRGAADNAQAQVEVELRSVNGKGLNLKLRLPSERLELEAELEARLRARLERGSVQGQVRVRVRGGAAPEPDRAALDAHLRAWRSTQKDLGLKEARDPSLAELLALPGAFLPAEEDARTRKAVQRAARDAADAAAEALLEARAKEGAKLGRELLRILKRFEQQLKQAEKRAPQALAATQERMRERVRTALEAAGEDADAVDLAREVVAIADRADVREEVARLHIHIDRIRKTLAAGGACGRELEFLLQEVHREVTTLGNKSSDVALSEQIVAMKLLAGQLKEQTANVE